MNSKSSISFPDNALLPFAYMPRRLAVRSKLKKDKMVIVTKNKALHEFEGVQTGLKSN